MLGRTRSGYISKPGVRIYHVDATLGLPFQFNNSYTSHKLIDWISAGNRNTENKAFIANYNELFRIDTAPKYDWSTFKWYSLDQYSPTVSVTLQEQTDTYAVVSIQYQE